MLFDVSLFSWPNINTLFTAVDRERFSALEKVTESKRLANCVLQLPLPMSTSLKCLFLLTIIIHLLNSREHNGYPIDGGVEDCALDTKPKTSKSRRKLVNPNDSCPRLQYSAAVIVKSLYFGQSQNHQSLNGRRCAFHNITLSYLRP
jgi:hypothetical protein